MWVLFSTSINHFHLFWEFFIGFESFWPNMPLWWVSVHFALFGVLTNFNQYHFNPIFQLWKIKPLLSYCILSFRSKNQKTGHLGRLRNILAEKSKNESFSSITGHFGGKLKNGSFRSIISHLGRKIQKLVI